MTRTFMTSYNYETFRANFDLVRLKLMLRSWHELCCVNEKLLFLLFQHKTYANQGILMWENCRSIKISTHINKAFKRKLQTKRFIENFINQIWSHVRKTSKQNLNHLLTVGSCFGTQKLVDATTLFYSSCINIACIPNTKNDAM